MLCPDCYSVEGNKPHLGLDGEKSVEMWIVFEEPLHRSHCHSKLDSQSDKRLRSRLWGRGELTILACEYLCLWLGVQRRRNEFTLSKGRTQMALCINCALESGKAKVLAVLTPPLSEGQRCM